MHNNSQFRDIYLRKTRNCVMKHYAPSHMLGHKDGALVETLPNVGIEKNRSIKA